MKKSSLILGIVLSLAIVRPAFAEGGVFDLTTTTGRNYRHCNVLQVAADGITFRHANGMAKVLFTDLGDKWRERFGYDPAKLHAAEQQQRETKAKARAAALQVAQQNAKAQADAYTVALERQTLLAVQQLLRQPIGPSFANYNPGAYAGLLPLGYNGYGSHGYNHFGFTGYNQGYGCNAPAPLVVRRGASAVIPYQSAQGSSAVHRVQTTPAPNFAHPPAYR